jgi:hypothetical protein
MRRASTESLLPTFSWQGQTGEILVDVLDRDDRFVNGLEMRAGVVDPDRTTSEVALEQVAPGRYRGEFAISGAGRYYVNLSGTAGALRVGPRTFGVAVPYSTEYLDLGVDDEHLREIAAATGGRLLPLASASLAAIAQTKPEAGGERWRVWWPLLLAALALLLAEVAVRKVAVPESWRARWRSLQERERPAGEVEPGYEELEAAIARMREQHLKALHEGGHYRPNDLAARARLYRAGRGEGGRQSGDEER